jgi:hypothetical protein
MADFEANPHRVETAPTISEETENDWCCNASWNLFVHERVRA